MNYGRILEKLLLDNTPVYKLELLLNEQAEFKSATAAKVYKEINSRYHIAFTLPDLNSDKIDENICEYRIFVSGDTEILEFKDFLEDMISLENDIDTYFIQKVLLEDLSDYTESTGIIMQADNEPDNENENYDWQNEKNVRSDSVRIDINKLNVLSNLAGELVTCKAQIIQVQNLMQVNYRQDKELQSIVDYLEKGTTQLDRISFELQENITQLRMVPVKAAFRKIPRIVRDLSAKCEKQVELLIRGEDTELDKMVLEQISDPLVHLIRNCVDHGIESPQERIAKGKSPKGKIHLKAYTEGEMVYIEVEDDGKGIDVDQIREQIIARQLATEDELRTMSDEQIIDFIFRPGFSTAENINEISGRGVGMDVVRKNISLVKGNIKVESKKNLGTRILIQIPLTIAIIKSLLILNSERLYLVPLDKVSETFKIKKAALQTVNTRKIISWNGEIIPILNLAELLGTTEVNNADYLYILVIQYRTSKVGIIVDRLLGEQEAVVKPLDKYVGMVEGLMGATILGDGKVALVLEPIGLIDRAVM